MPRQLSVTIGQYSGRGRKAVNQDFYGAIIPAPPLMASKGIAFAVADGISSSFVSRIASEAAIKTFLEDYYCTSDTWSVKTSARRVIASANSWLYAQTRRSAHAEDKDKGYVCTLTAVVVKSATAHIFHVGDARVYRLARGTVEQLTQDHRIHIGAAQSYLGRALGANPQVEIDYHAIPVSRGDALLLATDGVYEHIEPRRMLHALDEHAGDLDRAAHALAEEALRRGSEDNMTVQIVRIDDVPPGELNEVVHELQELPLAPLLDAGATFEGYRIVRELHASSRSHVYLAEDCETKQMVALKVSSIDLRADADYLKRFVIEDWVLRRAKNPHLLRSAGSPRPRGHLYIVTEYVEGQRLGQWMRDNPRPDLETVRGMLEQIGIGVQALHRMEMLHRDLHPDNVVIDRAGTLKIIDFGSVSVAGLSEDSNSPGNEVLGQLQYTAPECLLGEAATQGSDLFSLGVIAYQMLTGRLPYDTQAAAIKTWSDLKRLKYRPLTSDAVPGWVDLAIGRAVAADPAERYEELSEFLYDLRNPKAAYVQRKTPLIERNPLLFWQGLALVLALAVTGLLVKIALY